MLKLLVHRDSRGFTLIEMSIVLVVIGLIVGGILVGQDLIKGAEIRATIAQVEKFNTAVHTFQNKYGGLPGDLDATLASQFGFVPRGYNGNYAGMGDGNGVIEGTGDILYANANCGLCEPSGEPVLFWNDLTWANGQNINLIEGSFSPLTGEGYLGDPGPPPGISGSAIDLWLPKAKIGGGNYFYVWSQNGINYFGLSAVNNFYYDVFISSPSVSVTQAAAMDKKIDDGLPLSGNVTAVYVTGVASSNLENAPNATPDSTTTCYNSTTSTYSTSINGGAGLNCALSFQFQ